MIRLRGREVGRVRLAARRVVGEERTLLLDPRRQILVLRRVNDVDAAAEHRDRATARLKRRLMRRGIDPARKSRDDGDARLGKFGRKPSRDFPAVAGRAPRADDRERGIVLRQQLALDVEQRRRRGNLRQEPRVLDVFKSDRRNAQPRNPVIFAERIELRPRTDDALDGALVEHLAQLARRGAPCRLHRAELFTQARKPGRANVGHAMERDPISALLLI
jgi:hypothetical protein